MQLGNILEKARNESMKYMNSPHTFMEDKRDDGIQFIADCKRYVERYDDSKDRFVFLFSIFLHINSEDGLSSRLYNTDSIKKEHELSYDFFGYKEFNKIKCQDNIIFLSWLNSELFSYVDKKVENNDFNISENIFHQILKNAFEDLMTIKELIFDVSKSKRKIIIYGRYQEVYQYRKISIDIKNSIIERFTKVEFESNIHKVAYLIALIKYLSMYNEYTPNNPEREMYDCDVHDSIYKIYKCLEKELMSIIIKKESGRNPKLKTNIPKIKWKGKNTELRDLIIELKNKGWISIEDENYKDACESILSVFMIKGKQESFYEIMKPYHQKNEDLTEVVTEVTKITKIKEKKTRFSGIIDITKKIQK